jgi:phage terminase large subunit-like protein
LAASAGLHLDPWQQHVLDVALGERADGSWSAFEVALVVPRQNGKGAVLEARELAGLFLFGERLILHSAHEFKTAKEAFYRMRQLIEDAPHLRRRVRQIRQSNEEVSVELTSGQRLRYVARSGGAARGFSGDCVILDEAFALGAESMAALLPTLSARPNPQVWYTSSAGMASSSHLRAVRERGMVGSPRLAYMEWSSVDGSRLDDPEAWAAANPALGFRLTADKIAGELEVLSGSPGEFARERLGIWDTEAALAVLPLDLWESAIDTASRIVGERSFAVDVTPDRSAASIAVAGRSADGRPHVEVVDRLTLRAAAARCAELHERWSPERWVLDASGPAGSLIPELQGLGIEPVVVAARQLSQACGLLFDMVHADGGPELRHIGQASLSAAVGAARKRPLGDAWAWARKDASVDISPLVAVTLALWGAIQPAEAASPQPAIYAGFVR